MRNILAANPRFKKTHKQAHPFPWTSPSDNNNQSSQSFQSCHALVLNIASLLKRVKIKATHHMNKYDRESSTTHLISMAWTW